MPDTELIRILVDALKAMRDTHGVHGPCEENSCSRCDRAYQQAAHALSLADGNASTYRRKPESR